MDVLGGSLNCIVRYDSGSHETMPAGDEKVGLGLGLGLAPIPDNGYFNYLVPAEQRSSKVFMTKVINKDILHGWCIAPRL